MKNKKKIAINFFAAFISLVFFASLLTLGAHLYKRQNLPVCSNNSARLDPPPPSHELNFCDEYAIAPSLYKDGFYKRGWPYVYDAAAPARAVDEPSLDKLHQSEYTQQRWAGIEANFVVYFVALTVIYTLYLIVRARYAHYRH